MGGFTLSERDVGCLQAIVDGCRELDDEPIPAQVLQALREVLHTDEVSMSDFSTAPVGFGEEVAHQGAPQPGNGAALADRDRFILTLVRPHITDHYGRWLRAHPPSLALTRRQLAVLDLVRDGFTNDQVGRRLNVSEGTVRTHLNHVYERLGVASRTAAVTVVYGADVG